MDVPAAPLTGTRIPPGAGPRDPAVDAYRLLAADIAVGIAVAACRRGTRDVAVTVGSYLDVSYDPPTMLVSLYGDGRAAEAFDEAGAWTLSLLARGQRALADRLGTPGQPLEGLLRGVPIGSGPFSGAAIPDGALAWFDLETVGTFTAATHLLLVGEVRACGRTPAAGEAADPLVRFARDYRRLV